VLVTLRPILADVKTAYYPFFNNQINCKLCKKKFTLFGSRITGYP